MLTAVMTDSSVPMTVTCPTCGKKVTWSKQQRWRPFCSERCKMIDLGDWLDETHRIPGNEIPKTGQDPDD
jgi:endogenous inhibitor of DNA gyrase (YacG/DUF329 family)